MAKFPSINFYPKDWLADQALRACPAFARGVWIDMLMIMHGCEPYGHLTINGGKPMPVEMLAKLIGEPPNLVGKALGELSRFGVFEIDSGGCIYSRRMVRDRQRSEVGKEAAEKRWNSGKQPKRIISPNGFANGSTNAKPNGAPNGAPNGPPNTPLSLPLLEEEKVPSEPFSSSSENAASLASRKSLASPRSKPTLEKFREVYPANNGIDWTSENDCSVMEHWWAGLDAEEQFFAIEEIPNLLAWYNEAPTDPERVIWPANDWLQGRKWRDVWLRCPHLAPDARTQPEGAVA